MQHLHSVNALNLDNTWLTIGSFDGVHQGHQQIIRKLTAEAHAQGASAVVLTFHPHPAETVKDRRYPFYLTSPEEKAALLGNLGVDVVITHPFDRQIMQTTARDFMERLHRHLGMRHLIIGHDFALGSERSGDADALRRIGKDLGYTVEQIPPFEMDGQIVSSTRIRFLLGAGKVQDAAKLLGRSFTVSGTVVHGEQRGRTIGFPTANLEIWPMRAIPATGVYVCRTTVDGTPFGAVTNIGVRPTFEANPVPPRVEAHLLDFDGDLYGQSLTLEFVARLRGERRFDSVNALVAQIREDVTAARKVLNARPSLP